MEDLLEAFSVSCVSTDPNSTAAPHPHFALYKAKRNETSQEERRRKFLKAQKIKRYDYVSHARKLATDDWGTDDEAENADEENEEMDWDSQPRKPPRSYANQLMLSEWLVEVPSDLSIDWLLVLCPVGKRTLVVASQGYTKVYTKNGYLLRSFPSNLPGGNRKQRNQSTGSKSSAYSLLDCIFNEVDKTFYILDVMCWNSYPLFDSETEFRFFWIDNKLRENPNITEESSANPYKFVYLPNFSCEEQSLRETLVSPLPFPCKLDGLLFYHKKTQYTCGSTPLVGWLKGFMVPEMLQIEVPDSLTCDRPESYTSMKEHVPKAFKEHEKRKEKEEKEMQCQET